MEYKTEDIGGGIKVCTSKAHTFGTDAFLLSHFARPKKNEVTCDLGSGCGIIPLLWFRNVNSPKHAVAVDIQEAAVEQMMQSVNSSCLDGKFTPILADMRDIKGLKSKLANANFDLVTCNPPYKAMSTGVISQSSADKIARHETLCTIDECCAAAAALLRFGGRFCLCQLTERLVDVLEAMRKNKLEPKRIRFVQKDSSGAPWLFLVEAKLGSKPFLQAEPALLLYENGKVSPEMQEIYSLFGKI